MREVLELDNRERFCEDVSNHIFSRTIDKVDRRVLNTELDEVIANVDIVERVTLYVVDNTRILRNAIVVKHSL